MVCNSNGKTIEFDLWAQSNEPTFANDQILCIKSKNALQNISFIFVRQTSFCECVYHQLRRPPVINPPPITRANAISNGYVNTHRCGVHRPPPPSFRTDFRASKTSIIPTSTAGPPEARQNSQNQIKNNVLNGLIYCAV